MICVHLQEFVCLFVVGGKQFDFQPKYPPSPAKKRRRCYSYFQSRRYKRSRQEKINTESTQLVDLNFDCCFQSHRYKSSQEPTLVGCATKAPGSSQVFMENNLRIGPVVDKGDPTLPKKYKKDNLINFKADVISYPNRTASLIGHAEHVENPGTAKNQEDK